MKEDLISRNRRDALKLSVAALISLYCPWLAAKELSVAIKKTIPKSGETLSVIGLGSSRTFDDFSEPQTGKELTNILQVFFDQQGQLIDSSPMYGTAETAIGHLLQNVNGKEKMFVATKVWADSKQSGIDQMHASMHKMGVEVMDLMQIHNLRDWRNHLKTLRDWKDQGKIRYLGITTSHGRSHGDLLDIMAKEPLDFVQFSYNIMDREAENRLFPMAADKGIATLINRPFARGDLFRRVKGKEVPGWANDFGCQSWGQFFLKFVASHPATTCVIPATSKLKHMVDNMGANYGRLPEARERQRMIAFMSS